MCETTDTSHSLLLIQKPFYQFFTCSLVNSFQTSGSIKNLEHPWNLSIAQKVLYCGKVFFRLLKLFFTLWKQGSYKNCSMKGYLVNWKWLFCVITKMSWGHGCYRFNQVLSLDLQKKLFQFKWFSIASTNDEHIHFYLYYLLVCYLPMYYCLWKATFYFFYILKFTNSGYFFFTCNAGIIGNAVIINNAWIIKDHICMSIVLWRWLMATRHTRKQIRCLFFSKCFILIAVLK